MKLHYFQQNDLDYFYECGDSLRPIHSSPTGSGKTFMQAAVGIEEERRGRASAILTPRLEIFEQTEKLLGYSAGFDKIATMQGSRPWNPSRPIHIISWPTLITRVRKRGESWFPDVATVMIDECHLSVAPKMLEVLEYFGDTKKLKVHGWTATPARQSGKGLGVFYSNIHHVTTMRRLIDEGYLTPCEYWAGSHADTSGLKINSAGEWETKPLSDRSIKLVGDVLDNWLKWASDRHTLVFAVDIAHALALHERFLREGVAAAVVHNKLTIPQRRLAIQKFRDKTVQVLVNVNIASYGFDCPEIDCIVAARKTRSLVLWLQMLGRGMRVAPGKTTCMVLDHGDHVRRLGQATTLFRWPLKTGKAVVNWSQDKRSGDADRDKLYQCKNCGHQFGMSRTCPKCGQEKPLAQRDIFTEQAELVRITTELTERKAVDWPEDETFYRMLRHYAQHHRVTTRHWAYYKYIAKQKQLRPTKTPTEPNIHWNEGDMIPPDARVLAWIGKQELGWKIRVIKAKQKAGEKSWARR